ncbi:MAG: biotin biosynthesis protein BioY [Clostridia bacterium BRH_c25]|nr:MAG: biotin biosynthesis protein BioY [Clostridia bacterium BRH_c25]
MQKKFSVRDLCYISLFATLISVSGYIYIPLPFSTVPVTAQTLAVMLAGSLLPVGHAAASVLIFLLMGAIGLPVFSGGAAGLGIIIGKTGGYLIGFLAGAVFISALKGKRTDFLRLLTVNAVGGILLVYAFGVFWLNYITGLGISQAIVLGALPFIPGDIVKIIVAALVTLRLKKHVKLGAD